VSIVETALNKLENNVNKEIMYQGMDALQIHAKLKLDGIVTHLLRVSVRQSVVTGCSKD